MKRTNLIALAIIVAIGVLVWIGTARAQSGYFNLRGLCTNTESIHAIMSPLAQSDRVAERLKQIAAGNCRDDSIAVVRGCFMDGLWQYPYSPNLDWAILRVASTDGRIWYANIHTRNPAMSVVREWSSGACT